ncbi:MAG: hypothetical protein QM674_13970 [Burkholderiaceae bacterium]
MAAPHCENGVHDMLMPGSTLETPTFVPRVASPDARGRYQASRLARVVSAATCVLAALGQSGAEASPCRAAEIRSESTHAEVSEYFAARKWQVITFVGYSGAEYEHPEQMLAHAERLLQPFPRDGTVVNIGATRSGIGAVYELAKKMGFRTSGIVSSLARDEGVEISDCVDLVFYVQDTQWGGIVADTGRLSPTSRTIVDVSTALFAIGGGDIARDEYLAVRRLGKRTEFVPAQMNHRIAREKAARKGQPEPTDFHGALGSAQR